METVPIWAQIGQTAEEIIMLINGENKGNDPLRRALNFMTVTVHVFGDFMGMYIEQHMCFHYFYGCNVKDLCVEYAEGLDFLSAIINYQGKLSF